MILRILLLLSVFEAIVFTKPLWPARKFTIPLLIALVSAMSVLVLSENGLLAGVVLLPVGFGRVINLIRVAAGRIQAESLRKRALRTTVVFGIATAIIAAGIVFLQYHTVDHTFMYMSVAVAQFLAALVITSSVIYNLIHTRYKEQATYYSDTELPSVTVAIPARNASDDLDTCLESVLASNYPKLEVIVLDDDSRRPLEDSVKSFARDGVRFIRTRGVCANWLAKNQAYEQLAKEATGSIILFCSVDIRFDVSAIHKLITAMTARHKKMVSVLPFRLLGSPLESIIQPITYWWELAIPRRMVNRPSVISAIWAIRRSELERLGGFKGVRRSVVPEGHFAKALVKEDAYSLLRAGRNLNIQSLKTMEEQRKTAIRVRYPQIRQRLEVAILLSMVEALLLVAPSLLAVWATIQILPHIFIISLATTILLLCSHAAILYVTSPANTILSALLLPVSLAYEIYASLKSMFKYEFGTVEWKGREVSNTVMHVIPKLPSID